MGWSQLEGKDHIQGTVQHLLLWVVCQLFKGLAYFRKFETLLVQGGHDYSGLLVEENAVNDHCLFFPLVHGCGLGYFLVKILCKVEFPIFNFLISEEKGVVEIQIFPLLLNMQKLRQRIPFLINSGQQLKIITQFLFQLTYIHLPLCCISPYFSCIFAILTNVMRDKIIGLLWVQNLERLYLTPMNNFVEGIALFLQEKVQFCQLYFFQKT